MSTRKAIVTLADRLIREKGYNAFSFTDISRSIGIKTASIHYHFPTKTDLCLATIKEQIKKTEALKLKLKGKSPMDQLQGFLSVYSKLQAENNICLVGSLATDLNTFDRKINKELKILAGMILDWVTEIVREGRSNRVFDFSGKPRARALMIITNMLAIVQLSRLTGADDFKLVKETILKEIKTKNE